MEAAVIEQSYNLTVRKGLFRVLATVQYPFDLGDITVIKKGNDDDLNMVGDVSDEQGPYTCLSTEGDCHRIYDLPFDGDICDISGEFEIEFNVICRGTEPNCPLIGG